MRVKRTMARSCLRPDGPPPRRPPARRRLYRQSRSAATRPATLPDEATRAEHEAWVKDKKD